MSIDACPQNAMFYSVNRGGSVELKLVRGVGWHTLFISSKRSIKHCHNILNKHYMFCLVLSIIQLRLDAMISWYPFLILLRVLVILHCESRRKKVTPYFKNIFSYLFQIPHQITILFLILVLHLKRCDLIICISETEMWVELYTLRYVYKVQMWPFVYMRYYIA